MASLNCVEDVLMCHMYRHPICANIIRMNDCLMFEHETRLPDGNWLFIVFRYDSKSGLTAYKVFEREELKDVTEKYKNHPNISAAMQLINEEIKDLRAVE